MQVNIKNLIDDGQCYQTIRELRWPEGIECPSCQSKHVMKRGFDDKELVRQRYECKDCDTRFDDLTGVCVWNCEILRLTGGRASHKVRVVSMNRACQEVPPCQCLI